MKLYIIRLPFIVHLYKITLSVVVFFIFSKFSFFRLLVGLKGQKMVQNDKKFCRAWYLRNHTLYDCHLCYTCVK